MDYSMNASLVNNDSFKLSQSRMEGAEISTLFFYLLKNKSDFRNEFINVFCDYANEVCNPIKARKYN